MTFLMLTYAVLLPTLAGFLFVTCFLCFEPKHGAMERLFLGFGLGAGILTFTMFLMGILAIPYSVAAISLVQLAIIALLCFLLHRSGTSVRQVLTFLPFHPGESSKGWKVHLKRVLIAVLSGLILVKLFIVCYESSMLPLHTWDSWTHWSSGAKFIFYEKGLALDPAGEHFFGRGYLKVQRYPLNVPLMQVWSSLCMGQAHEAYLKIWNLLFFTGIAGLVFCAVMREASLLTALLAAFFVMSAPLLTFHVFTTYADLPLGYYTLGAAICFRRYGQSVRSSEGHGGQGMLALTGAFVALGVWTKMEGLFFFAAFSAGLVLLLVLERKPLRHFLVYLMPVAVIAIPWYVFLHVAGVPISYGEERAVGEAVAQGLHLEVLPVLGRQILLSVNFNIVFPFFFMLCLLGAKRILQSDLRYLFVVLFASMALFLLVYLGTENYQWVMKQTAVNRNILTFLPMIYYVAALAAAELLSGGRRREVI